MALTKKIDFGNGVVTNEAYIIISNININFENETVNFTVKTYLNKTVKDSKLSTIISDKQFGINTYPNIGNTNVTENLFEKYILTGNILQNLELYLITLDDYKDATII